MAVKYSSRESAELDTEDLEAEQPEIKYYYDYHPTKEDLMAESPLQFDLRHYLVSLLRWLYREESWFITGNLNISDC